MTMKMGIAALALVVGLSACEQDIAGPDEVAGGTPAFQSRKGTGLVLTSVTGLKVPLLGLDLGDVVIDQAVITNFALVETVVGGIVGVEVEGLLQLTGGVLGTDVVTENFSTLVTVTSSGPGQCDLITIDLAPINVNILGEVASVDVPVASVTGRGSGAVGSLLCVLGSLLSGLGGGGAIPGAQGVVNAINNQI
jgi:hypothetical protein